MLFRSLRLVNQRETEMRNIISEMHRDVYEGRYPMGCCGGGNSYIPPDTFTASTVSQATTLDQFSIDQKLWVEYRGQREASFGIVGAFSNIEYRIDGPGHKLEIHVNDLPKFQWSGRGQDFLIGVAPPNGHNIPPSKKSEDSGYVAPTPQMAQILQLDEVAIGTL